MPIANPRTSWTRWKPLRPSPSCRRTPWSCCGTSTYTWRIIPPWAHLRFGAQKPPKGRLHQPFLIDVGPPFYGGRRERTRAGSADAGRRGPADNNGESCDRGRIQRH